MDELIAGRLDKMDAALERIANRLDKIDAALDRIAGLLDKMNDLADWIPEEALFPSHDLTNSDPSRVEGGGARRRGSHA